MALVLGTNCGFVTEAPIGDPDPVGNYNIDTRAAATKHTTPASINTITEIGWYADDATTDADFEVGIYTDDGNNVPELLIAKSGRFAKGTDVGWKIVTGLNIPIDAETDYWLAVQLDDTTGSTGVAWNSSGGDGRSLLLSQSSLPADWGAGDSNDVDAKHGIYAVVEIAAAPAGNSQMMGANF